MIWHGISGTYISIDYFRQRIKKGEIGSSAMLIK